MLPYHTRPACPAEYVPLLYISFLMVIFGVCIQYIFRGKVAVCYKISLKYFSRLRNPASIERVIRLLCVPSALAISALLMPRKKCA